MNIFDFEYKIVNLDVKFNNDSEATYKLLVDDDQRIHDYKVIFKKLYIQKYTTEAHKTKKINNFAYKFRLKLLNLLSIEHNFWSSKKRKPKPMLLNDDQIKIVNIEFEKYWKNQTFQNIIYVITGSNPPGEGLPKSANVKTLQKKAVGFLLKTLNISTNSFYEQIHNKIWNNGLKLYQFNEWLKQNKYINEYFDRFNNYTERKKWKKDVKQLSLLFSSYLKQKYELDREIQRLRNIFEKLCHKKYQSITSFWENGLKCKLEYAHILSVKQIRKGINDKNDKSLESVSNPNNCLPLTPDMHTAYDNGGFYWNTNGKLIINKEYSWDLPTDTNKFNKIPDERIKTIQKYLKLSNH